MAAAVPFLLMIASATALAACSPGKPVGLSSVPPETAGSSVQASTSIVPPTMDVAPTPALHANEEAGIYARLARLENDVASMKGQIGRIAPALEKMPDLQTRLGELVAELKNLDARIDATRPHTMADMPGVKPAVKPALAKGLVTPVITTSEQTLHPAAKPAKIIPLKSQEPVRPAPEQEIKIQQVRVGDYPDKTRIVLDLTQKAAYTYDLDNVEKLLIVEVDASAWTAAAGADFAKSPIVASYTAQATDNGKYRLILQLRQAVNVLRSQALPSNGDKGDRIVLDLAGIKA